VGHPKDVLATGGHIDGVALFAEATGDKRGELRLILNHEQAHTSSFSTE
jgi:hypothetical protein